MRKAEGEIEQALEEMDLDKLNAFCWILDEVVRSGRATLEDFGTLALVRQEMARRRAHDESPKVDA